MGTTSIKQRLQNSYDLNDDSMKNNFESINDEQLNNNARSFESCILETFDDQVFVEANKDNYFTRTDFKKILALFPDYRSLTASSSNSNLRSSQKHKRIRWKEGEIIGRGSNGIVKIGLNIRTGSIMAVKQVSISKSSSSFQQERLRALEVEIGILGKFSHKNIVNYYGSQRTGDTFNIFLEYVPGGTVSSILTKFGPLNNNIIRTYTRQILEGLAYLHIRNTIHRDIKGSNILVDKSGVCKLADFGTAKRISSLAENLNTTVLLKGTINWMAPEVIAQKTSGRQADIWSVGCTVLEMATGMLPWSSIVQADANPMSLLYRIGKAKSAPPIPNDICPAIRDFLAQCFKLDPCERANVIGLLEHKFITGIEDMPRSISNHDTVKRKSSDFSKNDSPLCLDLLPSPSIQEEVFAYMASSGFFPSSPNRSDYQKDSTPRGGYLSRIKCSVDDSCNSSDQDSPGLEKVRIRLAKCRESKFKPKKEICGGTTDLKDSADNVVSPNKSAKSAADSFDFEENRSMNESIFQDGQNDSGRQECHDHDQANKDLSFEKCLNQAKPFRIFNCFKFDECDWDTKSGDSDTENNNKTIVKTKSYTKIPSDAEASQATSKEDFVFAGRHFMHKIRPKRVKSEIDEGLQFDGDKYQKDKLEESFKLKVNKRRNFTEQQQNETPIRQNLIDDDFDIQTLNHIYESQNFNDDNHTLVGTQKFNDQGWSIDSLSYQNRCLEEGSESQDIYTADEFQRSIDKFNLEEDLEKICRDIVSTEIPLENEDEEDA